jgi:dihydroneopterin aldolase / 2-amino-4-hydroxy-6-hydroxymethyldihydropteridine diphosphokinase / dihydropteroate synthase
MSKHSPLKHKGSFNVVGSMVPHFKHPGCNKSIRNLLDQVVSHRPNDSPTMQKVIPFPRYPLISASTNLIPGFTHPVPPTARYWTTTPKFCTARRDAVGRKTYIMATLNATPDSFSDGSLHNSFPAALSYVCSSVTAGADIIDIGGYSTRPGADFVTQTEEISRIMPIIQAVRSVELVSGLPADVNGVLISVDTFRAEVAEAGILAGANCINDVYAFTGQEYPLNSSSAKHLLAMRKVARDLSVPVVLMHSRGDPGSNKDYKSYTHAQDAAVLEGIRAELGEKVESIVKGENGVRRWFIIVDPGVGFSKTREDNLEILRHTSLITKTFQKTNPLAGYPLLLGTSRKSFLGEILAEADIHGTYEGRTTSARERGWATAAAVACAVQQEATVVRVHDALEMGDVVRVASALWS